MTSPCIQELDLYALGCMKIASSLHWSMGSSKGCALGTDYPSGPNLQVLQMSGFRNSIIYSLLTSELRLLFLMMYVYSLLTSDMYVVLLLHIFPLHLSRNFGLNGRLRRMGSMVRKSFSLPTLHLQVSAASGLSALAFGAPSCEPFPQARRHPSLCLLRRLFPSGTTNHCN